MSRMGRLERDIYPPTTSVVSISGKVLNQEAPNGLPCAVSDARVRILGCMDAVDYDRFHILYLFIFNSLYFFVHLQYLHAFLTGVIYMHI